MAAASVLSRPVLGCFDEVNNAFDDTWPDLDDLVELDTAVWEQAGGLTSGLSDCPVTATGVSCPENVGDANMSHVIHPDSSASRAQQNPHTIHDMVAPPVATATTSAIEKDEQSCNAVVARFAEPDLNRIRLDL